MNKSKSLLLGFTLALACIVTIAAINPTTSVFNSISIRNGTNQIGKVLSVLDADGNIGYVPAGGAGATNSIVSINGDTNIAQLIVAGTGVSRTTVNGTTTISTVPVSTNVNGYYPSNIYNAQLQTNAAINAQLKFGRSAFVDAVNGNDSTAATNLNLPFLTGISAQTALSNGIIVFRPGEYLATNLLKNGVNYDLGNARITYSNSVGTQYVPESIFNDKAGAITSTIMGSAIIKFDGIFPDFHGQILALTNPLSDVVFSARDLIVTNAESISGPQTGNGSTISAKDGSLSVNFNRIKSSGDDGLFWANGEMFAHGNAIDVTEGYSIWSTAYGTNKSDLTGQFYFDVDHIKSEDTTGAPSVTIEGNPNSRVWGKFGQIENNQNTAIRVSDGFGYLTGLKVFGGVEVDESVLNLPRDSTKTTLYLTTQKMEKYTDWPVGVCLLVTSGRGFIDSLEMSEYPILITNGLTHLTAQSWLASSNYPYGLSQLGGESHLQFGLFKKTGTGKGFDLSGGTTYLRNSRIDTSAAATGTTNNPIFVHGGNLHLQDVSIVAPTGTESITATNAQTVLVEGICYANTEPSANITFVGGTFIVGTNLTGGMYVDNKGITRSGLVVPLMGTGATPVSTNTTTKQVTYNFSGGGGGSTNVNGNNVYPITIVTNAEYTATANDSTIIMQGSGGQVLHLPTIAGTNGNFGTKYSVVNAQTDDSPLGVIDDSANAFNDITGIYTMTNKFDCAEFHLSMINGHVSQWVISRGNYYVNRGSKTYRALISQSTVDRAGDYLSYSFIVGHTYIIDSAGTDIFINIGYISDGTPFVATGTTPTSWNGDALGIYDLTTSAPAVDSLRENTLSGSPVFTYTSTGHYTVTLAGAFPADKFFPTCTTFFHSGSPVFLNVSRINDDSLDLLVYSLDVVGTSDNFLDHTSLIIQVDE